MKRQDKLKLRKGSWIENTNGLYEIKNIYEAAGGKFYTVIELVFVDMDSRIVGKPHDITFNDLTSYDLVSL